MCAKTGWSTIQDISGSHTPMVHAGGITEPLADEPLRVVGAKACLEFLIIRCVVTSPTAHPRGCLLFRTLILGKSTRGGADRNSPNKPDERYETQRADGHVGPHSHGVALNGDFPVVGLNRGGGWQGSSDGARLCTWWELGCGAPTSRSRSFYVLGTEASTKNQPCAVGRGQRTAPCVALEFSYLLTPEIPRLPT